ncbi:hypothetical protein [Saccharothrix deserti]|uniref:hypothetical protein n=1 Tax=Saccharothrix deserti TaxID=2593674 RepID=UPI00131B7E98|nr:hypothetical protein [Saccharothrix deserti]
MTEPLIPTELPESDQKDQPTWTMRGEQWARVSRHQWGVDVDLEIDGRFAAVLNPERAYALGLALMAAAQGPHLPRETGEYWGGGTWRSPND